MLVKAFLHESSSYRSLRDPGQTEEEGEDSDCSRSAANSMGGNTDDSAADVVARPMLANACRTAGKVRLYSILAIQVAGGAGGAQREDEGEETMRGGRRSGEEEDEGRKEMRGGRRWAVEAEDAGEGRDKGERKGSRRPEGG
eukprot:461863-Hanusia_phi.AAC.1